MNKKALIISNPGEPGASNFCKGVLVDEQKYSLYLGSALGGLWVPSELAIMQRPSVVELRAAMSDLDKMEYSLVIFTGHGFHSASTDSTILELRKGQEYDSNDLKKAKKRSIILDCCRVVASTVDEGSLFAKAAARTQIKIDPLECRKAYEWSILKCPDAIVVVHACAVGETAGDDSQNGGYYGHSLLSSAEAWSRLDGFDTPNHYYLHDFSEVHSKADVRVIVKSGGKQHPQIEKPRSGPIFPFAVVA